MEGSPSLWLRPTKQGTLGNLSEVKFLKTPSQVSFSSGGLLRSQPFNRRQHRIEKDLMPNTLQSGLETDSCPRWLCKRIKPLHLYEVARISLDQILICTGHLELNATFCW